MEKLNKFYDGYKKLCLSNSSYHQTEKVHAALNLISILEGLSSVWHFDIKEDKFGISHKNNYLINQLIIITKIYKSSIIIFQKSKTITHYPKRKIINLFRYKKLKKSLNNTIII